MVNKYMYIFHGVTFLIDKPPFLKYLSKYERNCLPESLSCTEVTCNLKAEECFHLRGRGGCAPWESVMLLVVMPPSRNLADAQVAPGSSPRQSSKPVFLEKLGGKTKTRPLRGR